LLRNILGVGLLCLMLTATPAKADPPADCLDIKSAERTLMARYRESKIFVGASEKGHLIVIYYNEANGSYSIGFVHPEYPDYICPEDTGMAVFKIDKYRKADGS
jgi:hypothetical protein